MAANSTQQPSPSQKLANIRQCIRLILSITTYTYLSKFLWCFNNEYTSLRNNATMLYGFTCLLWTPRFTPRSVVYTFFAIGMYGFVVKWMWWSVNRSYLELGCKVLSVVFGVKSMYLMWGLAVLLGAADSIKEE